MLGDILLIDPNGGFSVRVNDRHGGVTVERLEL